MIISCFVQREDTIQWYVHMLFCRTRRYNGMSICCFVESVDTMVCPHVVLERVNTMVCPYAVLEREDTMVCPYVVL